MHNYNFKFIFAVTVSVIFFLFSAAAQDVHQQDNKNEAPQANSRMPHVVTPLVNSSLNNPLYTPGKTNIIEIPAKTHEIEEYAKTEQAENSSDNDTFDDKEQNKSTTSADFLKLKSMGLLSNIRHLLSDKNTNISSFVTELDNAKTVYEAIPPEEIEVPKNNRFLNSEEEVSILRFEVNGLNIQSNCYNLYFSGIEANGAFLLTGDFRYSQGTKPCTETFFFLFTAEGTENGKLVYKVTSAVNQNLKNADSPLLAVSKLEDLNAYKTGGFVSIHDSKDDVAIDFLLTLKSTKLSRNEY